MASSNPNFVVTTDPEVGKPFEAMLVIEGKEPSGRPFAVVGRRFQIFSSQAGAIEFQIQEVEIAVVDAANNDRAEITFKSRDGFQVAGDLYLWVEDSLDPNIKDHTTITVAPATGTVPPTPAVVPPVTPTPAVIINPALGVVPPTPPAAAAATAAPVVTPTGSKTRRVLNSIGAGIMTVATLIGWPRAKKALEWIGIAFVLYGAYTFFSIEGVGSWTGWGIVILSLFVALAHKGGRLKLGWVIAGGVLIFFLATMAMVVVGPWYALKQTAQNGATSGVPKAPQIPAPPTPLAKALKKVLASPAPAVSPPATPTATATSPTKAVATKPGKTSKKKPPRTGSYHLPSL